MIGFLLLCAIELNGVVASDLRSRAYFDVNNVKVGDPMVLTLDFMGEADFSSLHPPALARAVSAEDWKVDEASAKTETMEYRGRAYGRRLTYRVRPRRAGLLQFPKLEFVYSTAEGVRRTVVANGQPVHAKPGRQVEVEEVGEDPTVLPMPDDLIVDWTSGVSEDLDFAWRKACASPSADAFVQFDCPEARLNEARCAILEGNWSRALAIYRRLEWRIGQTPAIERGLVAALARKYDNPDVELPVWRQVGRPLLKYGWKGRLSLGLGGLAVLGLLFWLLGRCIRALAAVGAVLLLVLPALAEETTVEESSVTTNADGTVVHKVVRTTRGRSGSMTYSCSSSSGGDPAAMLEEMNAMLDDGFFGAPFGSRRKPEKISVKSSVSADRKSATVGEPFYLVLSVEMPRRGQFAQGVQLRVEEYPGLAQTGQPFPLDERRSDDPANSVRRYAIPYRALQPLTRPLGYTVSGDVVAGRGFGLFARTTPYVQQGEIADFQVKPLPTEGRPDDFFGIVASDLQIAETADLVEVGTNDVVKLTARIKSDGYVPFSRQPEAVAYEWQRSPDDSQVEYCRYFVADGSTEVPGLSVSYFDPKSGGYRRASSRPIRLRYH